MRMTPLGNDLYQIRYHIRSFYGIQPEEPFLQLSFVFRNQNGSLVAKDEGEKDDKSTQFIVSQIIECICGT